MFNQWRRGSVGGTGPTGRRGPTGLSGDKGVPGSIGEPGTHVCLTLHFAHSVRCPCSYFVTLRHLKLIRSIT